MSTTPSIRRVSVLRPGRGFSAPIPRPVKPATVVTSIECVLLENPSSTLIAEYRSCGWITAYEAFNLFQTADGPKAHHFIRLEKATPVASIGYQQ